MSEYVVIYEQGQDGGWGAYLPDLPGVVALGDTHEEARERIREALDAYVAETRDRGEALPGPLSVAGTVRL